MNSLNGLKHEKGQNKNKNFRHSTTLRSLAETKSESMHECTSCKPSNCALGTIKSCRLLNSKVTWITQINFYADGTSVSLKVKRENMIICSLQFPWHVWYVH